MDELSMIDAIANTPANKVETPEEHAKRYPASRMQDLNDRYKQTLDSNILYEYIDMCKQYFKPHELMKMQKVFTQKIKDFNAHAKTMQGKARLHADVQIVMAKIANRIKYFEQYKPTISACMIVKDEAYLISDKGGTKHINLRACIASFINYVDELIICDTGSTDRTMQVLQILARKYPKIKIYRDEWQGYGTNRMKGIERATKDWVFIIDADERLRLKSSLKKVIRTAIMHNSDGIKLRFESWQEQVLRTGGTTNFRILPRKNVVITEDKHNQIEGVVQMCIVDDTCIEHYGYDHTLQHRKDKHRNDFKENVRQIRRHEGKKRGYYLYKAGESMIISGHYKLAIKLLDAALQHETSASVLLQALERTATAYVKLGDMDNSLKYYLKILEHHPENKDALSQCSLIYSDKADDKMYEYAQRYLDACTTAQLQSEVFYSQGIEPQLVNQATMTMIYGIERDKTKIEDLRLCLRHGLSDAVTDKFIQLCVKYSAYSYLRDVMKALFEVNNRYECLVNYINMCKQTDINLDKKYFELAKNTFSGVYIVWDALCRYYYQRDEKRFDYCINTLEVLRDRSEDKGGTQ